MSAYGTARRGNDPLQKRIPRNPKFDHIQSTVDSGDSVSRQLQRIERKGENVKGRPNELYKRMKITTFAQLIIQVCDYEDPDVQPTESANGYKPFYGRGDNGQPYDAADRDRADDEEILAAYGKRNRAPDAQQPFKSVMVGVGEMDMQKPPAIPNSLWNWSYESSCPYLLLDVRPQDDYEKFHIVTALNYPSSMLARSINYETKELLAYRNKDGRLIIVYDDDENIAPQVARTLCERGFDNIFLLTGGLKLAFRLFPKGFITKGGDSAPPGFSHESADSLQSQLDEIFADHSVGTRLNRTTTVASRVASSQAVASRLTSSAKIQAGRPPFKPA